MVRAFKPMHRLTEAVHNLGSSELDPETVQLTERSDEIGYLARGLVKATNTQDGLVDQATTDEVTGVHNRAALLLELESRFENTTHAEVDPFAFMILNVGGFEGIRTSLGHQASNELLADLAQNVSAALENGEFIARLNGGEFAVLSAIGTSVADQADLADRIADAAADTFTTSAGTARTTSGVGIVRIPQQAADSAEALRNANFALEEVRRADRGDVVLYHPILSSRFERRSFILNELRQALANESLTMLFQPVLDRDGDVVAVDSHVEWTDSTGSHVGPGEFVPAAEAGGLIDELGMWMMTEACQQIDSWVEAFDWSPLVSVDVSPAQLLSKDLVDFVEHLLEQYPAAKGRLAFDLRRNANSPEAIGYRSDVLVELKKLGVYLSIDDFGSDGSPLRSLSNLPVQQVKISQEFVESLANGKKTTEFLKDIVNIGKGQGLHVVIKGIESGEQFKAVDSMGHNLMQGSALGKPMAADQVAASFQTRHPFFISSEAS